MRAAWALVVVASALPGGRPAHGQSPDGAAEAIHDMPPSREAERRRPERPDDEARSVSVATRLPADLLDAAQGVTVVSRAALLGDAGETLVDALDGAPGVAAQTTNRGAGAPILRGQIGPSNLIVWDGVRFNNPTFRTGPSQVLNLFEPFFLERVEVLRGSSSVVHGSDAIGGVVSLRPLPLVYRDGTRERFRLWTSSADSSFGGGAWMSHGDARFATFGGVSWALHGDLRTSRAILPGSGYDRGAATAGVGWLVDPRNELRASWLGVGVFDAPRTDQLDAGDFRRYDNTNQFVVLRWHRLGRGAFAEVDAAVAWNRLTEEMSRHDCVRGDRWGLADPEGAPIPTTLDPTGCRTGQRSAVRRFRTDRDTSDTGSTTVTVRSRPGPDGLSVRWGADAALTAVESKREDRTVNGLSSGRDRIERGAGAFNEDAWHGFVGAFALVDWWFPVGARGSLTPEVGLRVTHARAGAEAVPTVGEVAWDDTGWTGSSRLVWRADPTLAVFGGWSQGFRVPNLHETTVLGNTGSSFEVPNASLRPERSDTVEGGARWEREAWRADLVGWALFVDDALASRPWTWEGSSRVDGRPVRQTTNADSGRWYGVESGVGFPLPFGVLGAGTFTWTAGEVGTGDATEPARRVPGARWSLSTRHVSSLLRTELELRADGELAQGRLAPGDRTDLRICGSRKWPGVLREDIGGSCDTFPGWTTIGFRASAPVVSDLRLRLRLENLLDRPWRTMGSGIDGPGFHAMVSLEWEPSR